MEKQCGRGSEKHHIEREWDSLAMNGKEERRTKKKKQERAIQSQRLSRQAANQGEEWERSAQPVMQRFDGPGNERGKSSEPANQAFLQGFDAETHD